MLSSITQPTELPEEAIHRSQRVTWLLAGVVVLSMVDLFLTITYLTTVGMSEGNPIAVWLLSATNSVWPLIVYKLGTVAVCVSLLYMNRYRRQGELASWCAMIILVALSVWWNQYSRFQPYLPYSVDHIVMVEDTFIQPFRVFEDQASEVQ
jgi:hypothetical protein